MILDWLQNQDSAFFQWINIGWGNPFLDPIMRFSSSNRFFMPAAILTALFIIWRGRLRGVVCVAIVLIAISIGDGFVYSALKNVVARPRPFETVPNAILRIGHTHSFGLPSSHAANWMCVAAITFIFYRRSAWLTLPIAILVGLSRVYNGVHYPGDVLVGMIVGAGCGLATLAAVNATYQWIGKTFFPLWWKAHPCLLAPPLKDPDPEADEPQYRPKNASGPAQPRHWTIDQHWMNLGYAVILLTLVARLLFLLKGPMELSPDEAYQWHWSKHLALSYLSKPPMIAYTQFLGTTIWGDTEFGVRFFAPVIAATLGLLLLRFFAREVNARAGFFLALMLTTTPMMAAGAVLMTVDPLSVLFWTAAMLAGWKAIRETSTASDWAWVGLWMGLGFLSKYTALFQLLCWAVFFWLWAPARAQLRRPGPWLALVILALCAIPVVLWNYQHEWVTVSHVAEDAGAGKSWKFTLRYLGDFLGAELGLLNPVFFVATIWASIAMWKQGRRNPRLVYFFSMGAPLFLVYTLFAFKSRVLPNWIAPSVIPLFCLAVTYWDTRYRLGTHGIKSWLFAGLLIGGVVTLFAHNTTLVEKAFKIALPPHLDPMRRVRGWSETAHLVVNAQAGLAEEGKPIFVIGDHYGITSEVSFYYPDGRWKAARKPVVYCRSNETPRNQFHVWPGYQHRKGENAVFIRELSLNYKHTYPAPTRLLDEFESVEEIGVRPVLVRKQKDPIRYIQIFYCRDLK